MYLIITSNRSLRHTSKKDILQVQQICIERPLIKELIYALEEANVLMFQEEDSVSRFSGSVLSDSLRPHESQHARPPYPSPTPGVHPNSCALSQ